jgi:hypothetical protein
MALFNLFVDPAVKPQDEGVILEIAEVTALFRLFELKT